MNHKSKSIIICMCQRFNTSSWINKKSLTNRVLLFWEFNHHKKGSVKADLVQYPRRADMHCYSSRIIGSRQTTLTQKVNFSVEHPWSLSIFITTRPVTAILKMVQTSVSNFFVAELINYTISLKFALLCLALVSSNVTTFINVTVWLGQASSAPNCCPPFGCG